MDLILTRFADSPHGVFGKLEGKEIELCTVERPWLDNQRRVSCIPAGAYTLKRCMFNRGGYHTYEVTEVPGRSEIKIHVANTMDDVIGCIGVGQGLGFVDGKWAVTRSKVAFEALMAVLSDTLPGTHDLEITWLKH